MTIALIAACLCGGYFAGAVHVSGRYRYRDHALFAAQHRLAMAYGTDNPDDWSKHIGPKSVLRAVQ